ncbi:MAG: DUF805 domain-containing protein [Alphaproteobacteria bacterium]
MDNQYKDTKGPWGSEGDVLEVQQPTQVTPQAQQSRDGRDYVKNWFQQSFSVSGLLNRKAYLITLIFPLIILIPYTYTIIDYLMNNTEILQQKAGEAGLFAAVTYMMEQMAAGMSPIKLKLYHILSMFQYVVYWVLLITTVKRLRDGGFSGVGAWILVLGGIGFLWPVIILVALCFPSKYT